jgi:glycosyltransferase involved in cell wall biosynthesis
MSQDLGKVKLPISLVIITLNEESHIQACIESAPFVSEVVVLDSGSTDKTQEIAQKLGAQVFSQEWKGFGRQKNAAAALAKNDWILNLDADERLSPELAREISERFAALNFQEVGVFPRRSFYLNRWIMHGGWYPDRQKRLYHRQHSRWDEAEIHEKVIAQKEVFFEKPMNHFVFRSIAEHVSTNNRYSGLLAKKDFAAGKRFSYFRLMTKPLTKFIETYLFKKGFLDGYAGFIIAVGASYSIFLRIAKLKELSEELDKNNSKNKNEGLRK